MPTKKEAGAVEDVRSLLPRYRNPVKVLRAKCLDCCCGSTAEVERCRVDACPLHAWRFGKNPYRKPKTPEQIEAARARALKMLAARASG